MKSLYILSFSLFLACTQTEYPQAMSDEQNGPVKHIVLLDLKDGCVAEDVQWVVEALYTLHEIEELIDLNVSRYVDIGDERLLGDFDIMLYTEFGSLEDLQQYSTNEFHEKVREDLKPYMEAKPRVIDTFEY